MSENTTAQVANAASTEDAEETGCPAKVFATKEEAKSAWTPPSPKKGKSAGGESKYKVFDIIKDEKVIGYVWGRGYNDALARWAKAQHQVKASYTNGGSAPTQEAVKESVTANVATMFTDEEWKALVKARKAGATPTQAVNAATAPKPQGK